MENRIAEIIASTLGDYMCFGQMASFESYSLIHKIVNTIASEL